MSMRRYPPLKNKLRMNSDPNGLRTSETKTCHYAGCNKSTRGDKGYCLIHVAHNLYANHVMKELENREYEDTQVKLKGSYKANLNGITAKEILLELNQHGPRTINRLSRELNIELGLIHSYVVALKKCNKIRVSVTRRGATVITGTRGLSSVGRATAF